MEFVGLFLDKKRGEPLYLQLYRFLVAEMRAGRVKAGEKLPGKRTAATQLGVSVNTVDEAYQLLASEGYVWAKPRSGFVANDLGQLIPPPPEKPMPAPAKSTRQESAEVHWRYSFLTGGIDTALFPHKTWNRITKEVLAGPADLFATGESEGDGVLREAIATYLRGYRGVRCEASQVVIGAGLEVLIGQLGRLLPEGPVAFENPGYPKATHIIRNAGRTIAAAEVDEQGIRPELLRAGDARAVYLTPSHQFPTGCVMPAPRRTALLGWAAKTGSILIEDDYDSEFRFDGRPLPSLQGMDDNGRVVYAGTFSRSLAPGIRASYLVLPPDMMSLWHSAYGEYACSVWRPEQHTLARFMSEGHFASRLNRLRGAYRRRRDVVLQWLRENLPKGSYEPLNVHTGLYFVLRLPGRDAEKLAQKARGAGLRIAALSEYAQPGKGGFSIWEGGKDALILGYGGLPQEEAPKALASLFEVLGVR